MILRKYVYLFLLLSPINLLQATDHEKSEVKCILRHYLRDFEDVFIDRLTNNDLIRNIIMNLHTPERLIVPSRSAGVILQAEMAREWTEYREERAARTRK